MVERIDILKDGASTIYGSDAIAGVVNIITRKNFDGAEAGVNVGQYSDGDGQRQAYDFTLGTTTDRATLMVGASYVKEDSVMAGDREISPAAPVLQRPERNGFSRLVCPQWFASYPHQWC